MMLPPGVVIQFGSKNLICRQLRPKSLGIIFNLQSSALQSENSNALIETLRHGLGCHLEGRVDRLSRHFTNFNARELIGVGFWSPAKDVSVQSAFDMHSAGRWNASSNIGQQNPSNSRRDPTVENVV